MTLVLLFIAACGVGPPHTPANLTVTTIAPIMLRWDTVLAATQYNIYRGTASGGLPSKTLLESIVSVNGEYPATTYTDTSAKSGTTYFYQVTAVNWNIESAASNETSASQ